MREYESKQKLIRNELFTADEKRDIVRAFGPVVGNWTMDALGRAVDAADERERLEQACKDGAWFKAFQWCPKCNELDCHWIEPTQRFKDNNNIWQIRVFRTCKKCGYSWRLHDTYPDPNQEQNA